MRRITRSWLVLIVLLTLALSGCVQEKADVLSEPEVTSEGAPEGEVVVGVEEEGSAASAGDSEPTAAPEAATAESGEAEAPTEGDEGEAAAPEGEATPGEVSSGGGIGDSATSEGEATAEGESASSPSTPGSGEVTAEVDSEPGAVETTVAVDQQAVEATPPPGDGEVAAQGESAQPAAPGSYTVQAGDTLYSIATQFGTTVDELRMMNSMDSNFITVGQVLAVPGGDAAGAPAAEGSQEAAAPAAEQPQASGPVTHTVQRGEWLYAIARRYNVSPQAIVAANPAIAARQNTLYPGEQLVIPGASGDGGASAPTGSSGQSYTVVAGDTLFGIAQRCGTDIMTLKSKNALAGDIIYVGQQLTCP